MLFPIKLNKILLKKYKYVYIKLNHNIKINF